MVVLLVTPTIVSDARSTDGLALCSSRKVGLDEGIDESSKLNAPSVTAVCCVGSTEGTSIPDENGDGTRVESVMVDGIKEALVTMSTICVGSSVGPWDGASDTTGSWVASNMSVGSVVGLLDWFTVAPLSELLLGL